MKPEKHWTRMGWAAMEISTGRLCRTRQGVVATWRTRGLVDDWCRTDKHRPVRVKVTVEVVR